MKRLCFVERMRKCPHAWLYKGRVQKEGIKAHAGDARILIPLIKARQRDGLVILQIKSKPVA